MRRKLVALLLLVLAPALLFAQTKLRLEFPSEGAREVWFGSDWPKTRPDTMETVEGAATNIAATESQMGQKLFVWDKSTGNIAVKPVKDIGAGWKLKPQDFQRIGQITLRVEHAGKPVSAAQVVAKSKGYSRDALIDSSSRGEMALFAVPPGELEVTVKYNAKDAGSRTLTQKFPLKLDRDTPDPVFAVSIVEEVATLEQAPAVMENGKEPGQTKPEDGGGNIVSLILTYVLSLGIAIGAGYLIFNYVRQNKEKVQEKLEALGVQVPQPQDAAAAITPPPAPFAPEPPQKIILDDAAPIAPVGAVDPYAPAPVAAAAPLSGNPRLVGDDGRVFELEEGLLAVGREDGLPISLVGESTVSRQHAEITRSGGEVTVTDLGSTNGTYVNGQKVQGDVQLRPGDTVQFGAVRFRYEG